MKYTAYILTMYIYIIIIIMLLCSCPELNDPVEQRKCLDLGKKEGLNIALITKSVVERIKNIGMVGELKHISVALFELLVWSHKVEPWFHSWYRC